MPFATGFVVLAEAYQGGEKRREVIGFLESLGFEVYDVGKPRVLVFYVEADTVKALEDVIKAAERHDGVVKAYVVYGFLGDREAEEMINRGLEEGWIELDETMVDYLNRILRRLEGVGGEASRSRG